MFLKNLKLVVVILLVALFGSQNVFAQKKGKEVVKTQPAPASTAKPCPCSSTTINNNYYGGSEDGTDFRSYRGGGSYSTFRSNPYGGGNRSIAYGYRNYNYNHNYNYYPRRNFPRVYNYGNNFRSSGGNFRGQSRHNSSRGRNR